MGRGLEGQERVRVGIAPPALGSCVRGLYAWRAGPAWHPAGRRDCVAGARPFIPASGSVRGVGLSPMQPPAPCLLGVGVGTVIHDQSVKCTLRESAGRSRTGWRSGWQGPSGMTLRKAGLTGPQAGSGRGPEGRACPLCRGGLSSACRVGVWGQHRCFGFYW